MFYHEIFGWELLLAIFTTDPLSPMHLLFVVYPIVAGQVLLLRTEAARKGTNIWPEVSEDMAPRNQNKGLHP